MSPATPIQGLLWRIWQQARWKLLTQQVLLLAVLLLIYSLLMDESITLAEQNEMTRFIVFAGLFLLYATCMPNLARLRNQWASTGFPHTHDFVLPIATWKLVLVPLLFWTALFIAAYLLPTLLLHWLAGTQAPGWVGCFLIAEFLLVTIALSWWTPAPLFQTLGWVTVAVLFWRDHLIPELMIDETTGEMMLASSAELFIPTVLTLACLGAALLGVTKQRHGETLGEASGEVESGRIRLLPSGLLSRPCPVDSPLAAELWLVREQRGFLEHLLSGILLGTGVLILLALGETWSPEDDPSTRVGVLLAASGLFLLVVAAVTTTNNFGISYVNEAPQLSVFMRTRPLASHKLFYTRFAVAYLGILLAAAGMWLSVETFGALFLVDFSAVRAELHAMMGSWLGQPMAELLRQTLRIAIILVSVMLLLSSARAGFTLWGRKLIWPVAAIPVYLLGVFIIIFTATERELAAEIWVTFLIQHLWIFVIGLPLATLYFSRDLLRENAISIRHLVILCAASLLCYLVTYTPITFSAETPIRILLMRGVGVVDGLIPLFAITLALWTMHRIRHA